MHWVQNPVQRPEERQQEYEISIRWTNHDFSTAECKSTLRHRLPAGYEILRGTNYLNAICIGAGAHMLGECSSAEASDSLIVKKVARSMAPSTRYNVSHNMGQVLKGKVQKDRGKF